MKVSIVDFGMGNLFSVQQACRTAGLKAVISSDPGDIMSSDAVVLPGVGAFGTAMEVLKRRDLVSPIKDFIAMDRPLLAICLGMQLLMSESEEFGRHEGLDVVPGRVVRFPGINDRGEKVKVPQVGWNRIRREGLGGGEGILRDVEDGEFMYFAHSYYVVPSNHDCVMTTTHYCGMDYCSSLRKNRVFAFQFHPEKSGRAGIGIYDNLKRIITDGECYDQEQRCFEKV